MTHLNVEGGSLAKISYALQPVPPKARKDATKDGPYAAHVVASTASLATLAQQMVREGSKFSEAEIVSMMTQMMDVIADRLSHGESVNLGSMVRLRPAIRGTFETVQTPFDEKSHQVVVTATIGSKLRKIVQGVKVELVDHVVVPKVTSVNVVASSKEDSKTVNFIVQGHSLLRQPCKKASEWFVIVGAEMISLTPIACDDHHAIFALSQEQLSKNQSFTLGLRVYIEPDRHYDILQDVDVL